ncbi:hypothetical protein [Nocardioides caricicola]|uniref:GNAT family N-acetyltransferase n=1 Tax=Nocardioides caricicola TaxID=634770 RepID=A0ABW0N1Z8_9ACTN
MPPWPPRILAEADGELVGLATVGPTRDDAGTPVELYDDLGTWEIRMVRP